MPERSTGSACNHNAAPDLHIDKSLQARELWAQLTEVHSDLNNRARRTPHKMLSDVEKIHLRDLFREVHKCIGDLDGVMVCLVLSESEPLNVSDALILISEHRTALRFFRVQVLGENPFTLYS